MLDSHGFNILTLQLHVYRCKSKDELLEQIRKHFSAVSNKIFQIFKLFSSHFQIVSPRKGGVACLLYSIVLSKGFYEYNNTSS